MWNSLVSLNILANLLIFISTNPTGTYENSNDVVAVTETISSAKSSAGVVAKGLKEELASKAAPASSASTLNVINNTDEELASKAAPTSSASTLNVMKNTDVNCAKHEKYEKCPQKLCRPQLCEHVGTSMCLSHMKINTLWTGYHSSLETESDKECGELGACLCIENFVRNQYGVCKPINECTSCGNDKNATIGCGVNCGRRCSNYKKKNVSCTDVCYKNSCECKKDYVFDEYTGKCVLPKDCSNKQSHHNHCSDKVDSDDKNDGDFNSKHQHHHKIDLPHCNKHFNKPHEWNIGQLEESQKDDKSECSNEDSNDDNDTDEDDKSCWEKKKDTTFSGTENNQHWCGCKNHNPDISEPIETTTLPKHHHHHHHRHTKEPEYTTTTESEWNNIPCKTNKPTKLMTQSHPTTEESSELTTKPWKPEKPGTTTVQSTTINTTAAEENHKTTKTWLSTNKPHNSTTTTTETTESQETGSKKCEGKYEKYYDCLPSCPDYTCTDYIEKKTSICDHKKNFENCKSGCKCRLGHYRDSEGQCVSAIKCKLLTKLPTKLPGK